MKWCWRLLGPLVAAAAIVISGPAWGQANNLPVEPALPQLLQPPRPEVMTNEPNVPEEGPGRTLFQRGPVRVHTAPVVVDFPSIAEPRPGGAVLPGITIRFPLP